MTALDDFRKKHSGRYTPPPVAEEVMGTMYQRARVRVPTPGSQRRCYNGCFPSSDWEMVWSDWEVLESKCPESRLQFWESLGGEVEYKWTAHSKGGQ